MGVACGGASATAHPIPPLSLSSYLLTHHSLSLKLPTRPPLYLSNYLLTHHSISQVTYSPTLYLSIYLLTNLCARLMCRCGGGEVHCGAFLHDRPEGHGFVT